MSKSWARGLFTLILSTSRLTVGQALNHMENLGSNPSSSAFTARIVQCQNSKSVICKRRLDSYYELHKRGFPTVGGFKTRY